VNHSKLARWNQVQHQTGQSRGGAASPGTSEAACALLNFWVAWVQLVDVDNASLLDGSRAKLGAELIKHLPMALEVRHSSWMGCGAWLLLSDLAMLAECLCLLLVETNLQEVEGMITSALCAPSSTEPSLNLFKASFVCAMH